MNKMTTSLIAISTVLVFTGVSQMTSSHVAEEQFGHNAVIQQDALQAAVESVNNASKQTLNESFDNSQIKTLDISNNGTEALHTAIWGVARDLPNGERELTMGKIFTEMTRQQDGSWKPIASTWTDGPFSKEVNALIASRDAQTTLNQTQQLIVAELTENANTLY